MRSPLVVARNIAAGLFVCSSAACLFPDLSGLTGGVRASDGGDGDVQEIQPPADGGMVDGTPPTEDASGEDVNKAETSVESGTNGPFCASLIQAPTLCADFDEGGKFNDQFDTGQEIDNTDSLGQDNAESSSPPNSCFANIGSGGGVSYMEKRFSGNATTVTYAFDVYVSSVVTGGAWMIASSAVINELSPSDFALSLFITDTTAGLEEQIPEGGGNYTYIDHQFTSSIPFNTWTRVSFTFDMSKGSFTASLNGANVQPPTTLNSKWPGSGTLTSQLGILYESDNSATWSVRYDNVVVNML